MSVLKALFFSFEDNAVAGASSDLVDVERDEGFPARPVIIPAPALISLPCLADVVVVA